ncbi:MAG TPA: hypothetical protein VF167_16660 [Longimicrobiaceae bacterium]
MVAEAVVTLRAHQPAPALLELEYRPLAGRLTRTLLALLCCWGALPFVIWIPPHYPWVVLAMVAGIYLAHRSWTGRYRVAYFAGLCPRCGHAISLGLDRCISLPHTLTCYSCHFEPRLEVRFIEAKAPPQERPEHRDPRCVGVWETRWLADEALLVCSRCHASCPSTEETREAARIENDCAALLEQLTREGRSIL